MDLFLLMAAVSESAARLLEQELFKVANLGRSKYLLRFATPAKDNLLISVRPDLPRLHLTPPRARHREVPGDPFSYLLEREMQGAVLASMQVRSFDRVVDLYFRLPLREGGARERRLVVELFGRSANVLLLDEADKVLGYSRELRSAFRAPAVGSPYLPPVPHGRAMDIPDGRRLEARSLGHTPIAFLEPLSPVFARDLRAAGGDEEAAHRRVDQILEAVQTGSWSPVVYSSRPLDEYNEGDRLAKEDLCVAALPLLMGGGPRSSGSPLMATPFRSPSEAAQTAFNLAERLRDFEGRVAHHAALVRREIERLDALIRKLEDEMEKARASGECQRLGEVLLAGLSVARVEGDRALVPNPYDPEAGTLAVPVTAGLTLQQNAQALFARYKKGKRGMIAIETRLRAARGRLSEWRALGARAASIGGPDDLEALRGEMARLGLVHAERSRRRGGASRRQETPTRVRRHTTSDGLVILVGKSGAENDALTFKVASPWDFWLHAGGHPGAHVVVRNPQRLKTLPEATLRTAAEIAAYYSAAKGSGSVEVHYTQRKHVHKRKGMPAGQVLLRRFRSLRVSPRLPRSTIEEV